MIRTCTNDVQTRANIGVTCLTDALDSIGLGIMCTSSIQSAITIVHIAFICEEEEEEKRTDAFDCLSHRRTCAHRITNAADVDETCSAIASDGIGLGIM